MKIKFNWGTGIFIAIVLFMAFILSFLYKAIAIDKYKHELISEDYYKDELLYQKNIDKVTNGLNLDQNVRLTNSKKGITILFPETFDYQKIEGNIIFQRLSNKKLDFTKKIVLKSHQVTIPDSMLVKGKWLIKIDWKYNNEEYLWKESWFY